ncbi:MAG: trehalose-phosphatase [Acidimicrobiales bacterium]
MGAAPPGRAGPAALSALLAEPRRCGLITDFDGTLAPIVRAPQDARPLPGSVDLLHRLAGRLAVVGVVSGRPARFLVDHVGVARPGPPDGGRVRLAGLYGLERTDEDGSVVPAPGVERWAAAVEGVAAAARAGGPTGLVVEHKGLALTLHWRAAPRVAGWAVAFASRWAESSGLVAEPGRMSVELRPPAAVDKGTVVAEWCVGLAAACFLGDDRGDLAAFAALDRLAAGGGFEAVKVAVASAELPEELAAAADVTVDGTAGALGLLGELARALG